MYPCNDRKNKAKENQVNITQRKHGPLENYMTTINTFSSNCVATGQISLLDAAC